MDMDMVVIWWLHTCQSIIVRTLRTPESTRGTPVNAPCPIEPCTHTRVLSPAEAKLNAHSRTSSSRVPTRYLAGK